MANQGFAKRIEVDDNHHVWIKVEAQKESLSDEEEKILSKLCAGCHTIKAIQNEGGHKISDGALLHIIGNLIEHGLAELDNYEEIVPTDMGQEYMDGVWNGYVMTVPKRNK